MSKFGNWLKKSGKNIAKIALPVAGIVAAVAIPGVGGAISGGISAVANKVLGKSGAGDALAGIAPAVRDAVADKPEKSGGLFGKGGLLGTGLLAGREWTEYNKTLKWAKKDSKMLEKASQILGFNVSDLDELKKHFGPQEMEELETLAITDLVNSGETPPQTLPPGKESKVPGWGWAAIAIGGAKLLGIW